MEGPLRNILRLVTHSALPVADLESLYRALSLECENGSYSLEFARNELRRRIESVLAGRNLHTYRAVTQAWLVHYLYLHYDGVGDYSTEVTMLVQLRAILHEMIHNEAQTERETKTRPIMPKDGLTLTIHKIAGHLWGFVSLLEKRYWWPNDAVFTLEEEVAGIKTVLRIKARVADVTVRHGRVRNKSVVREKIANQLHQLIERYSLRRLLTEISETYRADVKRDTGLIAQPDARFRAVRKYLLQLALGRSSDSAAESPRWSQEDHEVLLEATHLLVALDSMPRLHPYGTLFVGEDPNEYLEACIQQDAVYSENQHPWRSAFDLITRMFSPYREALSDKLGLPLNRVIQIGEALCELWVSLAERKAPLVPLFEPSELPGMIKPWCDNVTRDEAEHFCAIGAQPRGVNVGFRYPGDETKLDSRLYFLVKTNWGYFLPIPPMFVMGLYERLADAGRKLHLDLGAAFENTVRGFLEQQLNAPVVYGKYVFDGKVYETDGLMVGEGGVLIVECKLKAFSRPARGGNLALAVKDIAGAFVHASEQACRMELCLRKREQVELYPPGSSDKDILRGKVEPAHRISAPSDVEYMRLSISEGSFGVLHNAAVAANLLSIFMVSNVNGPVGDDFFDKKLPNRLAKLREVVEGLTDALVTSGDNEQEATNHIRRRTLFISFTLLALLLSDVHTFSEGVARLHHFAFLEAGDLDVHTKWSLIQRIYGKGTPN